MTLEVDAGNNPSVASMEAPVEWDIRRYDGPLSVKPGFYYNQEVYMTTIYDEMPRMTEREIAEWKRDNAETRIREALAQIRLVKCTLTDINNIVHNDDVASAEGQAVTLEESIRRIIDEFREGKTGS